MLKHTIRKPDFQQLQSLLRLYRESVFEANQTALDGGDVRTAAAVEHAHRAALVAHIWNLSDALITEPTPTVEDLQRALPPAIPSVVPR